MRGYKGKFIWTAVLAFLALGLVAGIFFWLSKSSLLSVDKIEVEGNITVPSDFIIETAGPYLRGRSLLARIDQRARDAIEELPYVESVDFDRRFPDTVSIEIREYQPVLNLKADGGVYLVASNATVLMLLDQPQTGLPLLTTKTACNATVGDQLQCQDARTGVQFMADIPPSFNYPFAEIMVDESRISATTSDGTRVNFGTLDKYELKFEVLRQLMARTATPGVTVTIDVSVPERPVTQEGDTAPVANDDSEVAAEQGEANPVAADTALEANAPVPDAQAEGAVVDEQ